MRMKRAMTKLSAFLNVRGVTLSVTALASGMSAELARAASIKSTSLMASHALAISSSLHPFTIIANTVQTMSAAKTSTLPAAAFLFIAAIPISPQFAEGSRMKSQLAVVEPGRAGPEGEVLRSKSRRSWSDSGKFSSVRTPASLLASFE